MESERFLHVVIPDNTTLKDIISLLNYIGFEVDINNKIVSKWLYDHKDWVVQDEGK